MTLSQLSKFFVWPEVSDLKCIYFLFKVISLFHYVDNRSCYYG